MSSTSRASCSDVASATSGPGCVGDDRPRQHLADEAGELVGGAGGVGGDGHGAEGGQRQPASTYGGVVRAVTTTRSPRRPRSRGAAPRAGPPERPRLRRSACRRRRGAKSRPASLSTAAASKPGMVSITGVAMVRVCPTRHAAATPDIHPDCPGRGLPRFANLDDAGVMLPRMVGRLGLRRPVLPDVLARKIPRIVGDLDALPGVRRLASRLLINHYGYATTLRPRALSLENDYTTWTGLTDRTFTGRHLPPADPETIARWPAEADVNALFRREHEFQVRPTPASGSCSSPSGSPTASCAPAVRTSARTPPSTRSTSARSTGWPSPDPDCCARERRPAQEPADRRRGVPGVPVPAAAAGRAVDFKPEFEGLLRRAVPHRHDPGQRPRRPQGLRLRRRARTRQLDHRQHDHEHRLPPRAQPPSPGCSPRSTRTGTTTGSSRPPATS